LNIDNSSENLNISLDNQTDTPCYPNFLPASQGQFTNPRTSQYMTFTPTNGELSVNTLYETTNTNSRKNIQDLETSYAVNLIKQLKPKKFTYLKQDNIKRFGLLSEDIPKTFQNEQLGVSNNANGVAYSELIAPIICSMNMIFAKLDSLEARFSQMEDTVKNMQNMAPSINPTVEIMSAPTPPLMGTPQTFADEVLTPADEVLTPADEVLTPADEVLTPADEVLTPSTEVSPQDIRVEDYFKLENYFNMKQDEIETPIIHEPLSLEQQNDDDIIEIDNVIDLVHLIAEAKKKYNK